MCDNLLIYYYASQRCTLQVHKDLDVFIFLTHVVFSITKVWRGDGGTQFDLIVTEIFLIKKISV